MRSWLRLTITFLDIENLQKIRVEQYQDYPIYHQSGGDDGKGFNPFDMIPNNFDDFWKFVSIEARYKLICTLAANGDYKESNRLFYEEDYADVFEHYTYNNCRGK